MARVARPWATIAACVWDSRTMPVLRSFWDAALDVSPETAGALNDRKRVGYESPDALANLCRATGLTDVSTGEIVVHAEYEGIDDLFRPFAAGAGHSGACFTALDEADNWVRGTVLRYPSASTA